MADDIKTKVEKRAAKIKARARESGKQPDKMPAEKSKPSPAYVLDCLSRNKIGDAALFNTLHNGKYLYVAEWKEWLYWTGNYWELDKNSKNALTDCEAVCAAYHNAFIESGDDEPKSPLAKMLASRLKSLRGGPGRRELLDCLSTTDQAPVVSVEELDQQPYLLATPTGVIDLRTRESAPGKQEQRITIACDTPWRGEDVPCPNFKAYMLSCMADDQEMADFIVRLLGYGLLGDKHLHIWAIMYGPLSRNGKDTLMNILKFVLGRRLHLRIPVTMLTEQKFQRDSSQPQADLMAIRGTRIIYASEANSRQALDQAKIKDLTGGGYITARGITDKYMSEWRQSALIFLLTNYLPKMDVEDDGFKGRTLCIEWPVKFVANPTKDYERQIDYDIGKKMEAEASGILAYLVWACSDVLQNGLRIPEKVLRYTQEQMDSFDDIGKFLKECCEVEDPPTGGREWQTRVATSELLTICNWWCKKTLGNQYPFTPKKLTPSLEKKGIPTKKSSVMYYLGVKVRPEILTEWADDMAAQDEKKKGRS